MAHSPLSVQKKQALPRSVGGTFTNSLSTLTSPGGTKNFAPACFSSARIRCAFNINPVYRSSGSAAAWIVVHFSEFGARLLLSFILVETHTFICSKQAGRQAGRQISLFQAMMKKRLWWSSHGKGRFLMSRLKNGDVALKSQIPCVCVCVREKERETEEKV
ncbi:hypothetical protein AMECASPLE_035899 [Ameca splendens]|uniref:Uncharacterized protein n=1 Tax=Ameca splendens TaxID=208324 RepID=A0ABV0Y856_9TELE